MTTTLIVPTLSRFDLLHRLLNSEKAGTKQVDNIIIVDNSGGLLKLIKDPRVITVTANNMGVGSAWNHAMHVIGTAIEDEKAYDPYSHLVIICNDDNLLKANAIEELHKLAESNPEHGFYGSANGGFSLFAMIPVIAFNNVGPFDPAFYPAYYEDNDYHYRMKLAGIDFICTEEMVFELGVDGQGSQTLNSNKTKQSDKDMINQGFMHNQKYYIAKWGGLPGEEQYTQPFNMAVINTKE